MLIGYFMLLSLYLIINAIQLNSFRSNGMRVFLLVQQELLLISMVVNYAKTKNEEETEERGTEEETEERRTKNREPENEERGTVGNEGPWNWGTMLLSNILPFGDGIDHSFIFEWNGRWTGMDRWNQMKTMWTSACELSWSVTSHSHMISEEKSVIQNSEKWPDQRSV